MNTHHQNFRQRMQSLFSRAVALLLLLPLASVVHATDLSYAAVPPFYSNGVTPNVALIIDTSSSMSSTDTGGSGSVTNQCSTSTTWTAPLSRLNAAKTAACQVVTANAASMRIALYRFSTDSNYNAVQLQDFTQSNATAINSSINGLSANASGTPLAHATRKVMQDIFSDSSSPIQYRCQKNFVVLFTDGQPSVGDDMSSTFDLPTLSTTAQSSTWTGSSMNTSGTMVSTSTSWDGYPDPVITWSDGRSWPYYPWLDDLSQEAYDVDIKTSSSAASTNCPTNSVGSSVGKDCAGKNWDATDDTDTTYKQQNVVMYTIGFGTEANNEMMRDTPLVNQISISPSQVNTTNDTITVTNHGLSNGNFIHYYTSYATTTLVGTANTSTSTVTVTSGGAVPTSGTQVTYSDQGGTTLTYDDHSTYTPTCGAINGLSSGTTYYVDSTGLTTNAFQLMDNTLTSLSISEGGVNGVTQKFVRAAVTSNSKTTGSLNSNNCTQGSSCPIRTTNNSIYISSHGFSTGDAVTYTSACTVGSTCIGGLGVNNTYYIIRLTSSTFALASTPADAAAGNAVNISRPNTSGAKATFARSAVTSLSKSVTDDGSTTVSSNAVNITSHGFSAGDAVTYTCTDGAMGSVPHSTSASTYYVNYVDATHFKLSLVSAATPTVTITNGGNANQTFTYKSTQTTIGGLYPYETDNSVAIANPTLSSNTTDGHAARGKYYVEVVDTNTIKLHQCGSTTITASGITFGCLDGKGWNSATKTFSSGSQVDLTSTGYGILSTGPGAFYNAVDGASIASALQSAFLSISNQSLSQASLTANVSTLASGAYIYTTTFNTKDWSGDILAYAIDSSTGDIASSATWQASTGVPTASSRNLITWSGSAGVTFPSPVAGAGPGLTNTNELVGVGNGTPASLTSAQQGYVVNWVRGTDTATTNLPNARTRSNGVIGDIMGGSPVYIGAPSASYDTTLPSGAAGQGSYATFRDITYKNRTPMLYAGANDGMLHGLSANSGVEVFGYIPMGVYTDWVDSNTTATNNGIQDTGETTIQKFYELTQTGYGYVATLPHRYFVDGAPTVGDAYFLTSKVSMPAGSWHTVLVGGLGKGGRTIYALDVTNPVGSFTQSNVLWEFDSSKDTSGTCNVSGNYGCMGYTYSKPQIARVKDGSGSYVWAAIFGNGYNANSDLGHLYVVNIETGAVIKRIDTGVAGGLSSVAVYTPSSGTNQGVATTVYAGDLLGNMWRFDISNASTGSWAATQLYTAKDSTGLVQPITAAPVLKDATAVPYGLSGGIMVIFGTGTYFQTSDFSYDGIPTYDSLYSVWDQDGSLVTKSQLQESIISTSGSYRVTSTSLTSTWPTSGAGSRGWFINLYAGTTALTGERIVFSPLQIGKILLFDTIIPTNTDPCSGGGDSWLYGVDAKTGGFYDVFTDLPTISGIQSDAGVLSQLTFLASSTDSSIGYVYVQGSNKTVKRLKIKTNDSSPDDPTPAYYPTNGRMSWRQLQ